MRKAFFELHLAILIAGWTGIFGKLIDMSAGLLVFWRVALAAALLWAIALVKKNLERTSAKTALGMCGAGVLLMLSWAAFYAAIKTSNVSVGVVAFSSVGFFTAIIEPLMTHRRINVRELAFSLVTIAGIALVFHFDTRYRLGIIFGLLSGLSAAILTIFFRNFRTRYATMTVLTWQLTGAFISALALLPLYHCLMPPEPLLPSMKNALLLVVFASIFTIGMYFLQVQALEKISAFTVNLSYNLEPVYSIVIAMILFGEARELNWSFWAGLALIALSVGLQTASVLKLQKKTRAKT